MWGCSSGPRAPGTAWLGWTDLSCSLGKPDAHPHDPGASLLSPRSTFLTHHLAVSESVCVCVHVCAHVYTCVCTCACMCACVWTCVWTCVCMPIPTLTKQCQLCCLGQWQATTGDFTLSTRTSLPRGRGCLLTRPVCPADIPEEPGRHPLARHVLEGAARPREELARVTSEVPTTRSSCASRSLEYVRSRSKNETVPSSLERMDAIARTGKSTAHRLCPGERAAGQALHCSVMKESTEIKGKQNADVFLN